MPSNFSAPPIELKDARLIALEPSACASLAEAIIGMPPWSVVNYPVAAMARFLADRPDGTARYALEVEGLPAGAVSVRLPFLKGPYLELLAILPVFQNRGLGGDIIAWFEREGARAGARNLWVCASSFNTQALRFYQRHGFQPAATLPGLVFDGYDEILLRKFPLEAGGRD